jgi:transcriptional regulator with XRE-family HTH domain
MSTTQREVRRAQLASTNLRSLRLQAGWDVAELALHAGVSVGVIYRAERRGVVPKMPNQLRIAKALDVPHLAIWHPTSDAA